MCLMAVGYQGTCPSGATTRCIPTSRSHAPSSSIGAAPASTMMRCRILRRSYCMRKYVHGTATSYGRVLHLHLRRSDIPRALPWPSLPSRDDDCGCYIQHMLPLRAMVYSLQPWLPSARRPGSGGHRNGKLKSTWRQHVTSGKWFGRSPRVSNTKDLVAHRSGRL